MKPSTLSKLADQSFLELKQVFGIIPEKTKEQLIKELLKAKRICLYGVGREGLMIKAFAMRLFHLGLDVHMVGDMTTPPVGKGDLFLVSSGPGQLSTVAALLEVAKNAKAKTLVITAQPKSRDAKKADVIIHLPAQTMASDTTGKTSLLPMRTLFEFAQLFFFEFVVLELRERLKQKPSAMRKRHTNLE